ncbi:WD40/YVTN/BNR-like repeat-containing protein [Allofustis seminis]|uniref:WD40/YVTN/BNR-like repeat-containing protein n=1 Tax=Allofustis seminis TaxID=166939 RepID=UPI00036640F0|nr:hypothetical protein [Allofustis seminis]
MKKLKATGYAILVVYAICMYMIWKICKSGGVRYWLDRMFPFAMLLIILLMIGLVLRHRGYHASGFKFRLALFISITLLFGGMIVHTAIPYNGVLSWKIDDLLNHKQITFVQNNIYEEGIDGILDDIKAKIALPDSLYVAEDFYIEFTEDGTITNVETMLYGENDKGQLRGFLISFDYKKGNKIDVWMNKGEGVSIDPDRLLHPFFTILQYSSFKEQIQHGHWMAHDQHYGFLYSGKETINTTTELYIVDSTGAHHSEAMMSQLSEGGAISGYEASLYLLNTKDIPPIRYLVKPQFISSEILENKHERTIIEEAKHSKSWIIDDTDSTVYHFISDNKEIGYRLVVIDAAAGSRYYALEKSSDGGSHWEMINQNPFMDETGVAEGIIFFLNDFGFIGLQGASGQYSQIYLTKDGGMNFRQVQLPMDKVTDIPTQGKEIGLTLDDYKYMSMPQYKEGKLFIIVTAGVDEPNGIEFYSEDSGESWHISKNSTS